MDQYNIRVNQNDTNRLQERYGRTLFNKAHSIIENYNQIMAREGKKIITEEKKIDTARLKNTITSETTVNLYDITGETYSGTKYGRFVHEGAMHEGGNIVPHFVSFAKVPSLFTWAVRHNVIKFSSSKNKWYFEGKNQKQYFISNVQKSGLMVTMKPIKFLEKPFNMYKRQFIRDLIRLVNEN